MSLSPAPELPLLLSVDEAAKYLRISRALMYQMIAGNLIDTVKIGKLRRVPHAALVEYVDRLRAGASAPRQGVA